MKNKLFQQLIPLFKENCGHELIISCFALLNHGHVVLINSPLSMKSMTTIK